jgi:hypothetical protein
MRKTFTMLALLAGCMVATLLHAAPEPSVLPTGFIFSTSGESLPTETIGKGRGVLLVLISKGNPGGEQLLTSLETLQEPLPADRLLVIVGGADDKLLGVMAKRHAKLAATWYRDTDRLLAKSLKLIATPATMGVNDAKVSWMIFGVDDPEQLEKTMRGWLSR